MKKHNLRKAADESISSLPFIKVKDAHLDTVVAFHKKAHPLKMRSESDLVELGIIAHQSGHKTIKGYFEILPTLAELRAYKMAAVEKRTIHHVNTQTDKD